MSGINKIPNKTVRNGDWRMTVFTEPWHDQVKIWLITYQKDKAYNVTYKDGSMLIKAVKEGEQIQDCFMKMPYDIYEEFCKLLSLAEIPQEESVTKAELTATKYHLEDMRKLVFKK